MNAVKKEIPNVIKTVLSLLRPGERDGLAVLTTGEFGLGTDDVSIVRDEERRLHENAERLAQFRYVGWGSHAADRVQIFVGKASARLVNNKARLVNNKTSRLMSNSLSRTGQGSRCSRRANRRKCGILARGRRHRMPCGGELGRGGSGE